jgi:hypothetical protein
MSSLTTRQSNNAAASRAWPASGSVLGKELNIMWTDVGEEIDDEVAIEVASRTSENANWLIMLVPGATTFDPTLAEAEVSKRLMRFGELFPHFEITPASSVSGWIMKWTSPLNSTFYVGGPNMLNSDNMLVELGVFGLKTTCLEQGLPFKLAVDNALRIAPMWHMPVNLFNDLIIRNYIVMGDVSNPDNSINLTKALPIDSPRDSHFVALLREQYFDQQAVLQRNSQHVHVIKTDLARQVAMPFSLMAKLPKRLSDPLLTTAFEQCTGRVPAVRGHAKNISVANHFTIINYCTEEQREDITTNNGANFVPGDIRANIVEQVELFLQGSWGKDYLDMAYRRRLQDIAQAVYLITGVAYQKGMPFRPECLVNRQLAEHNWRKYVESNNSDLTPCYDLLAVVTMQKGHVPSVDECRDIVAMY